MALAACEKAKLRNSSRQTANNFNAAN